MKVIPIQQVREGEEASELILSESHFKSLHEDLRNFLSSIKDSKTPILIGIDQIFLVMISLVITDG